METLQRQHHPPLTEPDLAARLTGKGLWKERLPQIIDTLEALWRVRRDDSGAIHGPRS